MTPRHASALPDQGAEDFELLAPALWNPIANAVVAAADVLLGERILDAWAGTGAGTIPAAQLCGPDGVVDAVDPSAAMLDLARAKAEALNLENIRFTVDDPAHWTADPYDAVLCCYGLFLVPDMAGTTSRMAGLLRPGGRFALSTWNEGALEGFEAILLEACAAEQPGTARQDRPEFTANWEKLASEEKLRDWLGGHGFGEVDVQEVALSVPLEPEMAWSLVLGSGYRTVLPVAPELRGRIRERFTALLGGDFVLNADSLVATARLAEPGPSPS
ncbi:class I SAM-dependent methyltransferase [Arthrobacter sp. TMN-37]